ncbi:MAG: YHYH protein, partial [Myxococcales bacterium]|nr:YHYH protein [Myxococcales bacterium]
MTVLSLRSPARALVFALATGAVGCESDSDSTSATADAAQAGDDSTDVVDAATGATDGASEAGDDSADGATDAVDGATDATDGSTDAVDGSTDGTDGTADGVVATCEEPGEVTTPTPICDGSTTTCNVELFECTRTAKALSCELSVEPQYSETIVGNKRIITANGVPTHDVGPFPNSGNPNSISAQSYTFEVPVTPSGAGSSNVKYFGILKSGVVLDPGTAETWNDDGSWRYEALRYGTATGYFESNGGTDTTFHPDGLGLDCNLAHVQPTGAYHYHG